MAVTTFVVTFVEEAVVVIFVGEAVVVIFVEGVVVLAPVCKCIAC